MTAPVPHGYPDYNRVLARNDVIYVFQQIGTAHIVQQFGPFFVGNARSIYIDLRLTGANAFSGSINWSQDQGGVQVVAVDDIEMHSGTVKGIGYTVKGPWFILSLATVGGDAPYQVTIAACSESLTPDSGNVPPFASIAYASQNIAAGATRTDNAQVVTYGECDWMVFSSAATWQANLEVLDSAGTVTIVDIMNQTMNPARRRVFLPDQQHRIRVTNQTGAAVAFTATVIPRSVLH